MWGLKSWGVVLVMATGNVLAAPLDALLTATPERGLERGYLELGADVMNQQLDVLNFRTVSNDPDKTTGDYNGAHISGGGRVGEKGWVSGSLWQRAVGDATDTYHYTSWQLSGQYRFMEAQGSLPALGVRLSAWGNYAAATETTKPVVVPGARLDTVKVASPSDQQLQADVVGTWQLSDASDLSLLLSAGTSQLSYGGLSATTTMDGCHYQLAFTGNAVYGKLASPCSTPIHVLEIYDNSGRLGIDVANEIAWRGSFVQAGVNGSWRTGPWTMRAGYLFHMAQRESVDAILAARKQAAFTQNHNVTLEGSYRLNPSTQFFARGQLSSNLFFNDLPVTYNTSTAPRFEGKYSLFTVGLLINF
jgi:hypothetical protein